MAQLGLLSRRGANFERRSENQMIWKDMERPALERHLPTLEALSGRAHEDEMLMYMPAPGLEFEGSSVRLIILKS